jgi:hypothetical protein
VVGVRQCLGGGFASMFDGWVCILGETDNEKENKKNNKKNEKVQLKINILMI